MTVVLAAFWGVAVPRTVLALCNVGQDSLQSGRGLNGAKLLV